MPVGVLGITGVFNFWTRSDGTAGCLFQFFNNGSHKGHSLGELVLFVGISNAMWLVFPIWGLCTSIQMILEGSYAMFL